jgi:hypothetical protein
MDFGGCMWMYDIGQVSCTGGDVDLLDFEEMRGPI